MPVAAIIPAAIGAAGAIGGALINKKGASNAAKAQQQSQQAALAEQQRQFDLTRGDYQPFLQGGQQAFGAQGALLGLNGNDAQGQAISALQASPLYQSLFRNGQEAVLQNASATGGLRGGNTQRSLADFGADTLASVIQQQLAGLSGMSQIGAGAAGGLAASGQANANARSNALVGAGDARASGALGQANAINGGLNNLGSVFGKYFGGGFGAGGGGGVSGGSSLAPLSSGFSLGGGSGGFNGVSSSFISGFGT